MKIARSAGCWGLWFLCLFAFGSAGGCGDKDGGSDGSGKIVGIGHRCTFSWPKRAAEEPDCGGMPICHPLQEPGSTLNNAALPVDCVQMPAMECEDLICMATVVDGDTTHMNGQCRPRSDPEFPSQTLDCPDASLACGGYCSKECSDDAGCPSGYRCAAMQGLLQHKLCRKVEWDRAMFPGPAR